MNKVSKDNFKQENINMVLLLILKVKLFHGD